MKIKMILGAFLLILVAGCNQGESSTATTSDTNAPMTTNSMPTTNGMTATNSSTMGTNR